MPAKLRQATARGLALAISLWTTACAAPMSDPILWTCQVKKDGVKLAQEDGLGLIVMANGCIDIRAARVAAGRLVVDPLPQWEKAWLLNRNTGRYMWVWGEIHRRPNARGGSELEVDLMPVPPRTFLEPWSDVHIAQLLRATIGDIMWDAICEAALAEALRRESRALAGVAAEVLEAGRHDLSASYVVSRLGVYEEVVLASLDVERGACDNLELTLMMTNKGKRKARRVGGLVNWGPRISVIDGSGIVMWSNYNDLMEDEYPGLRRNHVLDPGEEVGVWRDVMPKKLPAGRYTIRWWVNDDCYALHQHLEGACVMVAGESDFVVD